MEINAIYLADIFGTYFFAISAALVARRYAKLDAFGVGFVSVLGAVGGGTIRDWLLNAHPIAWIENNSYLLSIIVGVVTAFLLARTLDKFQLVINVVDILGVAFFTFAGIEKSLAFNASPSAAIFLGMVSGVCGGIMRDIACNEVPKVFKSEVYATLLLAGGAIKLGLEHLLFVDATVSNLVGCSAIVLGRFWFIRDQFKSEYLKIKQYSKTKLSTLNARKRKQNKLYNCQ